MDNLTHSLIGFAVGETAAQLSPRKTTTAERHLFWLVSILANNFPDADIFYARLLTPGPIGGLLHHRGHTHTLLAAPLLGLMLVGLLMSSQRWRSSTQKNLPAVLTLAFLGGALHVLMDGMNSYGVHPFWPWSSRWVYGDTLFIVEPWLWTTLLALAFSCVTGRKIRIFLGGLYGLIAAIILISGYVPWFLALGILIWAFWLWGLSLKLADYSPRLNALINVTTVVAIISFFGVCSQIMKAKLTLAYERYHPNARLYDIALSPMPGNPICWIATIAATEGADYVATTATTSLVPNAYSSVDCPRLVRDEEMTVPMAKIGVITPLVSWEREFRRPKAELDSILKNSCEARAVFQFMRAPFWAAKSNSAFDFGDLRFARSKATRFATFHVDNDATTKCPPRLPSWKPPRSDLFKWN